MNYRRFVILDRDGTIIVEKKYLSDPLQVELLPRAAIGLRHLRRLGLGLIVVTNQSGVGRGYFDLECLDRIHLRMCQLLRTEGIELDGIYFCPHTPEDDCLCRKPRSGLLAQAAVDFGFDPASAFVLGDKPCDVDLGRRVGATTLLVRTGYGAETESAGTTAHYVVDNLEEAARLIEQLYRVEAGVTIS